VIKIGDLKNWSINKLQPILKILIERKSVTLRQITRNTPFAKITRQILESLILADYLNVTWLNKKTKVYSIKPEKINDLIAVYEFVKAIKSAHYDKDKLKIRGD